MRMDKLGLPIGVLKFTENLSTDKERPCWGLALGMIALARLRLADPNPDFDIGTSVGWCPCPINHFT